MKENPSVDSHCGIYAFLITSPNFQNLASIRAWPMWLTDLLYE